MNAVKELCIDFWDRKTAINAMLRKVDPYTVYFPKKKDDDLRMMTQGKYGGIGALIQQREVPIQQAGTPAS